MDARPAYASFGQRVAALILDSAIIAAAFAAIAIAVNVTIGPYLIAFWTSSTPVRTEFEQASRTVDTLEDGTARIAVIGRETRIFADGTVRIYMTVSGTLTAPDGAVEKTHAERLIGRNGGDLIRAWASGVLVFALAFVYFLAFETSAWQATPGKALFGLKVTDAAGGRIGFGRSLARQLLKCLEIASDGITYLIAAFTGKQQALHDMFAGTLVVRTAVPAAAPRGRALAL